MVLAEYGLLHHTEMHRTALLTGNRWLGFYSIEVLGPERGYGSSQLQIGGVPTVGMNTRGGIVHQLFCFNLISHVALWSGWRRSYNFYNVYTHTYSTYNILYT